MQIKSEIEAGHFKPNCALVIVNFMIRHGIITPDSGRHCIWMLLLLHYSSLEYVGSQTASLEWNVLMLCNEEYQGILYLYQKIYNYVFAATNI